MLNSAGVMAFSTAMPGGGPSEDKRFSVVDMAALGGVLGALLLLALLGLTVLVHKHYGSRLKCCSGKAPVRPRVEGRAGDPQGVGDRRGEGRGEYVEAEGCPPWNEGVERPQGSRDPGTPLTPSLLLAGTPALRL